MKKNKFKPENIIKLCTSVTHAKEVAKSRRIVTRGLEIEAKEEDYTTANAKSIILFLQAFHLFAKIIIFLATLSNKLLLQLVLNKYGEHLIML